MNYNSVKPSAGWWLINKTDSDMQGHRFSHRQRTVVKCHYEAPNMSISIIQVSLSFL